ncbi:MAG: BspA family leucine-rich repeat surface protein [Treponema sp.]|nr:BspA family leucine-rich repeat surface protein [Treponema sp.]
MKPFFLRKRRKSFSPALFSLALCAQLACTVFSCALFSAGERAASGEACVTLSVTASVSRTAGAADAPDSEAPAGGAGAFGGDYRTVLPDNPDSSGLTDVILTAAPSGSGESERSFSAASLSALNASLASAAFYAGTYDFTLSASLDGITYSGNATETLSSSASNTVAFTLMPAGDWGAFSLTLTYSGSATRITGSLINPSDDTEVLAPEDLTPAAASGGTVIYAKGAEELKDASVEAGMYRVSIAFFGGDDGDIPLNSYRELVRVVPGLTSHAVRSIDLNELYTITYWSQIDSDGDGTLDGAFTQIDGSTGGITFSSGAPLQFSRKSADMALPDAVLSGHGFCGWYTDESLSAAGKITTVAGGTARNIHVYASWDAFQITVQDSAGLTSYSSLAAAVDAITTATGAIEITLYSSVSAADLGKSGTEGTVSYAIKNTGAAQVGLSVADGETVVLDSDSQELFYQCTKLKNVDAKGFDTSGVTNMEHMFSGCSALTTIDLSTWNTENVTTMAYLFDECTSLAALNLRSFDTSLVTKTTNMFNGCASLSAIQVSSSFTTASVTDSAGMFTGCTSLTGGAGTAFDPSYTDATYACIDKAGTPGYFTGIVYGLYVSSSGNDDNDGQTSTAALKTLEAAVGESGRLNELAEANGVTNADWVVYVDGALNGTAASVGELKAASLSIVASTTTGNDVLSGGGAGTVLSISASVPVVVSGLKIQSGSTGIATSGTGAVSIKDCTVSMNSSSGIAVSGTGAVTISGCTIGGSLSGNGNETDNGGGIYAEAGTTVTISDTTITGNNAKANGGGIYNAGSMTLKGAIIGDKNATSAASDSLYANKATASGGGIYNTGTLNVLDGTVISFNYASESESADAGGGGIFCDGGELTIEDGVLITYNCAKGCGGGIVVSAGCEVTMKGGSVSSNASLGDSNTASKMDGGGGMYVAGSSSVKISGGSISDNTSKVSGAGIFVNSSGATLTMSGGTISGNAATCSGGGVYNKGTFFMYGTAVIGDESKGAAATLTDNSNSAGANCHGAGIYTEGALYLGYSAAGTTADFTGGIFYNYAAHQGGGIYTADSAVVKMNGGSIKYNCVFTDGGGVRLGGSEAFEMTGGAIEGNVATRYGGGVYSGGTSAFRMSGGKVDSNNALSGAGVYNNGGTIAMTGGSVIGNSTTGTDTDTGLGGGIYNTGSVYLSGTASVGESGTGVATSSVHSNSATQGGGIYQKSGASSARLFLGVKLNSDGTTEQSALTGGIYRNYSSGAGGGIYVLSSTSSTPSILEMYSGTISENAAPDGYGGGVYAVDKGSLILYGGTIAGNAAAHGGAVALNSASLLPEAKLKGSISIPAGDAGANDFYLNTDKSCVITIDGELTADEPVATVLPKVYTAGKQVLADGDTSGMVASEYAKFAVTPDSTGEWTVDSAGCLKRGAVYASALATVIGSLTESAELKVTGSLTAGVLSVSVADAIKDLASGILLSLDLSDCTNLESITSQTFYNCTALESITLPATVTQINGSAFYGCTSLTSFGFAGTTSEWNALTLGTDWNKNAPFTEIVCSDGSVLIVPSVSSLSEAPSSGTYGLSSRSELETLLSWVNTDHATMSGVTFVLSGDIDLEGVGITPIGSSTYPFCGTFDGAGHEISNYVVSQSSNTGLFGYVSSGAVIQNLTLSGSTSARASCGMIANVIGSGPVTVNKCITNVSYSAENKKYIGGIAGWVNLSDGGTLTITNCANYGSVASSNSDGYLGGIIGHAISSGTIQITNCANYGSINGGTSTTYCGGLVGNISSTVTLNVSNCLNAGTVGDTSSAYSAAVMGTSSDTNPSISNCYYLTGSVNQISETGTLQNTSAFTSDGSACVTSEAVTAGGTSYAAGTNLVTILNAVTQAESGLSSWKMGDSGYPELE